MFVYMSHGLSYILIVSIRILCKNMLTISMQYSTSGLTYIGKGDYIRCRTCKYTYFSRINPAFHASSARAQLAMCGLVIRGTVIYLLYTY